MKTLQEFESDLKSSVLLREAAAKAAKKGKNREERIELFVKEANRLGYAITVGDLSQEDMNFIIK